MAPGPRARVPRVVDTAAEARKRYSGLIALRPPRVQSIQGLVEYAPDADEDGRVEKERETGSLLCQDNDKEVVVEDDDGLTALPILYMSEVYRPKPRESIDVGDNGPKTQGGMDGRAWWRSSSGAKNQQDEELRPGMMHGDYDGVVLVPPSVRSRGGLPHPNGLGDDEIEFLIPGVPSGRQSRKHPQLDAKKTSTEASVQDTSTDTSSIASQQTQQGWRAKLIWLCCGLFFGDKRRKQRDSAVDIPLMQGSSFATDKNASGEENVSSSIQKISTSAKGAGLEGTNKVHTEDDDEDDGQEMTFEQMLATAPPDETAIIPTVPYRDVGGWKSRRNLLKRAVRKAR